MKQMQVNIEESFAKLVVEEDATLFDALRIIEEGAETIAFVCSSGGRVLGTLTDGDVRRAILSGIELSAQCLTSIMNRSFIFVPPETGRAEVLDIMRARDIRHVPILDKEQHIIGLHTIRQVMSPARLPNAAVILAGGRGTRLAPLTQTIPKPMVTVAGRPILERLVLHLMSCGIRKFYLSVNYLAHVIEDHFGDGSRFGCHIEYLREEKPLGTGGSLSLLPEDLEDAVVVMNGDLVTQCAVEQMIAFHEKGDYTATFGVRPYTVDIPFGVVRVEDNRLLDIQEKPRHQMLINAGMYVLSPDAVRMVPRDVEFPITELFARCLQEQRPIGAHLIEDEWCDVGQHEELNKARGIT